MAARRKERKLRRRIKQIRDRHPHHWKNAIWAWSNRGDSGNWRRKLRRFRAYREYAEDVEAWLIKNMKPGEERAERRAEMDRIVRAADDKIRRLRKAHPDHPEPPPSSNCKTTYDGKTVPTWMVPWLNKIRAAGWDGVVVSGVRTSAYSQHLCCLMCNACDPGETCPGRCAGIYSNHNCDVCCFPKGALDVSDYVVFARLARQVGAPFFNALPVTDPVHFSNSGR
jgi:hypothetical protein